MSFSALPDSVAIQLLAVVAGPRLRASASAVPRTADLLDALADTFGPPPVTLMSTDADLARAALSMAAEDPVTRAAIDGILEDGGAPTYAVVETVAVVTAALAVLQTEVTVERTPAGKWRVKLQKSAASDSLLRSLAWAIMRALGDSVGKAPPELPK